MLEVGAFGEGGEAVDAVEDVVISWGVSRP